MFGVRIAQPDDRSALHELEAGSPFEYADILERGAFYPWWQMLVITHNERVVGTISLAIKSARAGNIALKLGHIFALRVLPDMRRQKVGVKLLLTAERILKDLSVDAIYAYVGQDNFASQALFQRQGFEPITEVAYLEYFQNRIENAVPVEIIRSVCATKKVIDAAKEKCFATTDIEHYLFNSTANPYFLGTFQTKTCTQVSAWDKDAWLSRLRPGEDGIFCCEISMNSLDDWKTLPISLLQHYPAKNKITFIVGRDFVADAIDSRVMTLNRIESLLTKWLRKPVITDQIFLDIRD